MRGDPIPNDDNVLRYARPNLVDGDDVDGGAFQKRVRDDEVENGLFINWVEAFAGIGKDRQISEIRRLFRLAVKKNGRFAELPVGATIEAVLDGIGGLTIEEDPLGPAGATAVAYPSVTIVPFDIRDRLRGRRPIRVPPCFFITCSELVELSQNALLVEG